MYDALHKIIKGNEFTTVEEFTVPGQPAKFAEVPRFLFDSQVGVYLNRWAKQTRLEGSGLWAHQVHALEMLGRGENVVVSTGTASGKSKIFQSIALHKVLRDPNKRAIVFYPLKALSADQIGGWRAMARDLKLDEDVIGRIDGSVRMPEREGILQKSKIVVMTPDVCQAWLMSRLSMPEIKKFVKALSTIIMDETHTLEGVLGSNFAFLLRRMIAARNHILGDDARQRPVQLIAATATIKNPEEHMKQLTGSEFSVVDHTMDGSEQHDCIIAHIACPENEEFTTAKNLQNHMVAHGTDGTFITFVDSRKGAEELAVATESDHVLPYRAGYEEEERQHIEHRLRSGDLQGVVSTSALELGIDVPYLRVSFNIGIPSTRKTYRQRLGRVGRRGPGIFVVIAPQDEFLRYGTSLQEYHDMSVEPSYLYLDNRFMQFAHGRCLADEMDALRAPAHLPAHVGWPATFKDVYAAARPGGNRPVEFDAIAELGGDKPQYSYPLRTDVGDIKFGLKLNKNADDFGHQNYLQALRECYPGATYFHMAKAYRVVAWHIRGVDPFILLKSGAPSRRTRPRIRTWIHARLNSATLIDGNLRRGKNGFLAECEMQVTERVEGYVDKQSGNRYSYRDLQQQNPNMHAYSRTFRPSGVVLCINQDWFKKNETRRFIADLVKDVFAHEYSILTQDVSSVATNIVVQNTEGKREVGGCIALFDQTHGSLRLTERLYRNFEHILTRLEKVATDEPAKTWVSQIRAEFSKFGEGHVDSTTGGEHSTTAGNYIQVFAPKSRCLHREQGQSTVDVTIIQPLLYDDALMYQVECPRKPGQRPTRRLIPASRIEPGETGQWEYAWWNTESQEYENPPDEESDDEAESDDTDGIERSDS